MKRIKCVYNTAVILSILQLFFQSTLLGFAVLMFIPIPWLPNTVGEQLIFDQHPYLVEMGYLISFLIGILVVLSILDIAVNVYLKRNRNRCSRLLSILMVVSPSGFIFYNIVLTLYLEGFNTFEVNSANASGSSVLMGILFFSIIPILSLVVSVLIAMIQNGIVLNDSSEELRQSTIKTNKKINIFGIIGIIIVVLIFVMLTM